MAAQLAEARQSLQALREQAAAQEEGARKVEGRLRERLRALETEKEVGWLICFAGMGVSGTLSCDTTPCLV